jgi:ribosomal protein S20
MTVGGIHGGNNPYISGSHERVNQRREDFSALANALSSGDLAGAQQAFTAVQQDLQQAGKVPQNQAAQATTQANTIGTDLDALSKSLESGDLAGAQSAFATLQKDIHKVHHHGHRHSGLALGGLVSGADSSSPTGVTQTGSDFRALLTSIRNGDSSGAQTALDSLLNDLKQAQTAQQAAPATSPAADMSALSKSLGAGDLEGAKSAFALLQQHLLQRWQHQQPYEAAGVPAASAASVSGAILDETS